MGKKTKNKGYALHEQFLGAGKYGELLKRYNVQNSKSVKPSARNMPEDFRTRDDVDNDLITASNKDYDTRKAQETLHLALTNKDFYNTLGKKAQNFVDNYKGGDKKDKDGISGISNMKELQAVNDFGKLYHKHERNLGGSYSSANDYGGGSMAMMDAIRQFHDRNSLIKDDQPQQEPDIQAPKSLLPDNYTPSKETAAAQDFVSQYEESIRNSPDGLLNPGSMGESQTLKGSSFNAEDAAEENDKAQGFFQDQLLKLTEGFKKYNINTVGPNSIASKNRDLLRTFPTT